MYEFSKENLEAIKALAKLEGILIEARPKAADTASDCIKTVLDYLLSIGEQ